MHLLFKMNLFNNANSYNNGIILGLGSNAGDSLNNLRQAVQLLHQSTAITLLAISPLYGSEALLLSEAPAEWRRSFLNAAISCTTTLTPDALLKTIKAIERQLGRVTQTRWAPRCIDIDILAWGHQLVDQEHLQIPHPELLHRPFALWPLLDLWPEWQHPRQAIEDVVAAWGAKTDGKAPLRTQQIAQRLAHPGLVAILNITPDSFSDGGQYATVEQAVTQAQRLCLEGAEVIDIGAESTRPGAVPVTPRQEWARLAPVLETMRTAWQGHLFKPKISLDSRHPEVVAQAVSLGIDWINDVSGFADVRMREIAVNTRLKCVFMHNLEVPPQKGLTLAHDRPLYQQVQQWAERRLNELQQAGILKDQLLFDIGIGFGKTAQQSFQLLKDLPQFHQLGIPLLVGHSRKSFFKLITASATSERDTVTAIVSYHLAKVGVSYVRVHNVAINAQALRLADKLDNLTDILVPLQVKQVSDKREDR